MAFFPQGQSKLCVNMWCPYQAGVPKTELDCSHNAVVLIISIKIELYTMALTY